MKIKELQEFVRKHNGSVYTTKDLKPGDIIVCFYNRDKVTSSEVHRYCDLVSSMGFSQTFLFVPDVFKFEIISVEE
jgi:hypothetical protein